MTNMTQPVNKNDSNDKSMKMNAKIKESWSKLSDDDVKLYDTNRAQFFTTLQQKQNVTKMDAEKKIAEIATACGCGTSHEKDGIKKAV